MKRVLASVSVAFKVALLSGLLATSSAAAGEPRGAAMSAAEDPRVFVPAGRLVDGQTWEAGSYRLGGSLSIHAPLTVRGCTEIIMPPNAAIVVSAGGSLQLRGTEECPIKITSASSSPAPGDWRGIEIWGDAVPSQNLIEHAIIEYAGSEGSGAIWLGRDASVVVRHTTLRHLAGTGVLAVEEGARLPKFLGNRVTDCGSYPLTLGPSAVGDLLGGRFDGNAIDAVRVVSGVVDSDATWQALGVPYHVENLYLRAQSDSAHLTLLPGVVLEMAEGATLTVSDGAGLMSLGAKGNPVRIVSALGEQAAPGDWYGIVVRGGSTPHANVLSYTVVEHAGAQGYAALWLGEGASVEVQGCSFVRNAGPGVELAFSTSQLRAFRGNNVVGNGGYGVALPPEAASQLGPGAYGPNALEGVMLTHGSVTSSATWGDLGVPYVVTQGVFVGAEQGIAVLTWAAGTQIAMAPGASLSVGPTGRLVVDGTQRRRVTVTSAEIVPRAGDWDQLAFYGSDNIIRHATLAFGGGAGYGQLWLSRAGELRLEHVDFLFSRDDCDVHNLQGGELVTVASHPVLCSE